MANNRRIKFCKLDHLIECFIEPSLFLSAQSNGTGIPSNVDDFEQFCFNQHDYGPYCARKWFHRCGTPLHSIFFERLYLQPFQENLRRFCQPNGTIQNVKLTDEYRHRCIYRLQTSYEWIHDQSRQNANFTKFYQNTCCAYYDWEHCVMEMLMVKCGRQSQQMFHTMIEYNSLSILNSLCPRDEYDFGKQQCDPIEFHAPNDYHPKGIHSNSIVSYLFSYYCPNIGYGIDDQQ
ncbi:uncharacterized protein LOC124490973 [Dermatophagoides farinae]|uniref:uncharacterized protein LOC124490973 n=1 Tax=Dermatophagoides farinae TaxID=6954 RepID=UPI003F618A73